MLYKCEVSKYLRKDSLALCYFGKPWGYCEFTTRSRGANTDHQDCRGQTSLLLSSRHGHQNLLPNFSIEGRGLTYQINLDRRPCILLVLSTTEIWWCCYLTGGLPLINKTAREWHPCIMLFLLDTKTLWPCYLTVVLVSIHFDSHGETPLFFAIERRRNDIVEAVLNRGACIHHQSNDGWTPL